MEFEVDCYYKYKGFPFVNPCLVPDKIYECKRSIIQDQKINILLKDDRGYTYEMQVPINDTSFIKSGINHKNWTERNNIVDKYQKAQEVKDDRVHHPSHYTWLKDKCGIEVIDITRHLNFNIGNVIKYVLRAGHKSEEGISDKEKSIEDLQKAIFYLKDEIKRLQD